MEGDFFPNFLCESFYRNIYQTVEVRKFIPIRSLQSQWCHMSLFCHIQHGIKNHKKKKCKRLTALGQKCCCPTRSIIPLQEESSNQPKMNHVRFAIGKSKKNRKCCMKSSDSYRCKIKYHRNTFYVTGTALEARNEQARHASCFQIYHSGGEIHSNAME